MTDLPQECKSAAWKTAAPLKEKTFQFGVACLPTRHRFDTAPGTYCPSFGRRWPESLEQLPCWCHSWCQGQVSPAALSKKPLGRWGKPDSTNSIQPLVAPHKTFRLKFQFASFKSWGFKQGRPLFSKSTQVASPYFPLPRLNPQDLAKAKLVHN